MASDWPQTTVEQIAARTKNALVGGPFGSNLVSRDYVESGVPVIRGQNMRERWISGEFAHVTPEKAESLSGNLARPGDIVFTQRGTLGQVSLVPPEPYEHYLVSQSQMKLTVDRDKGEPLFFYYVFCTSEQQHYVRQHAIQTGVPHTNLGILRGTPVPLPPLPVQKSIVETLGSLDDKVELNRRMNETLEAIARAIFKSWFVDFDPVRAKAEGRQPYGMDAEMAALFPAAFEDSALGKIPKRWKTKPLDELANFLNGLALQRYPPTGDEYLPVIKIRELRQGITESSGRASLEIPAEYVVVDGDVLFSWSGSLELIVWCGGRGALNQHLFKVTSSSAPPWFFYHSIMEHLPEFRAIAAGKATTMGHIQRHHLSEALTVTPDEGVLRAVNAIMEPMWDKVIANNVESRTLAELRDTLLPELLSGEVRVSKEHESVEANV